MEMSAPNSNSRANHARDPRSNGTHHEQPDPYRRKEGRNDENTIYAGGIVDAEIGTERAP